MPPSNTYIKINNLIYQWYLKEKTVVLLLLRIFAKPSARGLDKNSKKSEKRDKNIKINTSVLTNLYRKKRIINKEKEKEK